MEVGGLLHRDQHEGGIQTLSTQTQRVANRSKRLIRAVYGNEDLHGANAGEVRAIGQAGSS